MNRFNNSLRNVIFGLSGQILNIIASFAYRTVLTSVISQTVLGVTGVFSNILMVFSLADLGVGTAIIFSLYKPIAEEDRPKIQALMKLYQKAYILIGFIIIALGLIVMPFLGVLINSEEPVANLNLMFMLFVINTASTYFLSYKGTLITANQKNYIVTNVVYATSVLCYVVQIIVLKVTGNYLLTLTVQVGTNILQGIITTIIANRMYPYIKGKTDVKLSERDRKSIFKNMGSLMFYRTGQVIINGTDSMIISAVIGTATAGIYSQYTLMTTTIRNLLQQVFNAVTASIGNLTVVESNRRKFEVYNALYFTNFWMFGFATVCFFVLFRPFIYVWVGDTYLITIWQVLLISLNFYLIGMRNVNLVFRDTMGVFREGRNVPIISAVVNVGVSILCAHLFGLTGALLGTTISMLGTLVWMEPVILYKYGFKRKPGHYFYKYIHYFISVVIAAAIAYGLSSLLPTFAFWAFCVKILICLIVPNGVFWLLYHNTREFNMVFGKVLNMLKGKFGRKKRNRRASA